MEESIIIPIKGLKQGEHSFKFEISGKFFKGFENSQIKDAECTVKALVTRHQTLLSIACQTYGFVVTECDRCLEDLTLKVDVERVLTVGFGTIDVDDASDDEDLVVIDPQESELCIDQFIYDYICLSLPIVKVHPEGKCNPEMLEYLSKAQGNTAGLEGQSPFGNLKEILDNKDN